MIFGKTGLNNFPAFLHVLTIVWNVYLPHKAFSSVKEFFEKRYSECFKNNSSFLSRSSGPPEGFDNYPHSDILNDSYRKWNNEFRAPNEEKIQIPKIFTPYGFK